MREPRIIGIAGGIGSGKSTVAGRLELFGFVHMAFSEPICAEVDHAMRRGLIPRDMPADLEALFMRMDPAEIWAKPTSDAARRILQWWSVEKMKLDPKYWYCRLAKRMVPHGSYALAGCRMPIEVHSIQDAGGEVWWIDGPTVANGYENHVTERMTPDRCNRIIDNTGTLDQLFEQVDLLATLPATRNSRTA